MLEPMDYISPEEYMDIRSKRKPQTDVEILEIFRLKKELLQQVKNGLITLADAEQIIEEKYGN